MLSPLSDKFNVFTNKSVCLDIITLEKFFLTIENSWNVTGLSIGLSVKGDCFQHHCNLLTKNTGIGILNVSFPFLRS